VSLFALSDAVLNGFILRIATLSAVVLLSYPLRGTLLAFLTNMQLGFKQLQRSENISLFCQSVTYTKELLLKGKAQYG
jgi:hypothetical protein